MAVKFQYALAKKGAQLGVTKVFIGSHVGSVGKIDRGDLLAPLRFDVQDVQKGLLPAGDQEIFAVVIDLARSAGAERVRRRLAEKVAGGVAEMGIGAGPGSESAHAVVDDLGGLLPVDLAVLPF